MNTVIMTKSTTALITAITAERRDIFDFLLERKDLDVNGKVGGTHDRFDTALIAACARRTDYIYYTRRLIVNHRADINAITATGEYATALISACATDNPVIVQQLLNTGAEIAYCASDRIPPSALAAAIMARSSWSVLQLIEKNGSPFVVDPVVKNTIQNTARDVFSGTSVATKNTVWERR